MLMLIISVCGEPVKQTKFLNSCCLSMSKYSDSVCSEGCRYPSEKFSKRNLEYPGDSRDTFVGGTFPKGVCCLRA